MWGGLVRVLVQGFGCLVPKHPNHACHGARAHGFGPGRSVDLLACNVQRDLDLGTIILYSKANVLKV